MTRDAHALAPAPDDRLLIATQLGDEIGVDLPQPREPTAELAVAAQESARPRHLVGVEIGESAPAGGAAGEDVIRSVTPAGPAHARGLPAQAVAGKERPLELLPLPQEQAHERSLLAQSRSHLTADRLEVSHLSYSKSCKKHCKTTRDGGSRQAVCRPGRGV